VRPNREELIVNRQSGELVSPSAVDDKPTACVLTYLGGNAVQTFILHNTRKTYKALIEFMLLRIMSAFTQIFELKYDLFGIYKYCEEKEKSATTMSTEKLH
jgi:hypothetical protein